MNWTKILANAGFAFFTVLAAFSITGATQDAFVGALWGAGIQGGLAAFTEMKDEADGKPSRLNTLLLV